ncbi:hypothetical protein DL766_004660 [Monosporascus sp. MC13-8B]|uniref:Autophagy-related protein n=1 Tax=Monosporascus cannonballus TaxID=155416 RepID=A0ABY0HE56_9PEZI|nr:hypothetical protein DL763_007974 [Monosporascus cannonballus]RYO91437.1 hypothetical protein DL762_002163 [Monosporascus cannonballus]RYP30941.1 hypothetical protein DL766_004660 [Monosporascus sp. MC13-8B]
MTVAESPAHVGEDEMQGGRDNPENGSVHLGGYHMPLGSSKAFWGWLTLNLSTGPTSAMLFTYLPAAIQTVANTIGHVPGSDEPCAAMGVITCVVPFGSREVDYLTYFLYLSSITRAVEAVACIITSGIADYSRFRKPLMMSAIYSFGALSLPLAALTAPSLSTLHALSALYCVSTVVMGVFMIIQASYIPIFMASVRGTLSDNPAQAEPGRGGASWAKGAKVSTWGIVMSNIGMVASVLVGVIIAHAQRPPPGASLNSYLLAMTVSGAVTISIAVVGHFLLPGIPGIRRPRNESVISLPFRSCWGLVRSVSSHPEAFKFCAGWVLWDAAWFNFIPLLSSLFLETTGLDLAAGAFSIFTLLGIVAGCVGCLAWMYAFPQVSTPIKTWLYTLLGVNILCVFWGCVGISARSAIGLKWAAEFWVIQVLFMTTNSALLSYNRVVYASFIPKGSEALLSGLIFILDLVTGWILPLIQGAIQDNTHNLRYSMLLSLGLMVASIPFFVWVRVEKGTKEAGKPLAGFA